MGQSRIPSQLNWNCRQPNVEMRDIVSSVFFFSGFAGLENIKKLVVFWNVMNFRTHQRNRKFPPLPSYFVLKKNLCFEETILFWFFFSDFTTWRVTPDWHKQLSEHSHTVKHSGKHSMLKFHVNCLSVMSTPSWLNDYWRGPSSRLVGNGPAGLFLPASETLKKILQLNFLMAFVNDAPWENTAQLTFP